MIKLAYKLAQFLLFMALLAVHQCSLAQVTIPKKPGFIPPIIDSTQTLSKAELASLYEKLKIYSDSTSTEIFVMMVKTTQGESINRYATDLGHAWEIGQKGKVFGLD